MPCYDMLMSGMEYYIIQCHDKAMSGTYIVIEMSRYDITILKHVSQCQINYVIYPKIINFNMLISTYDIPMHPNV